MIKKMKFVLGLLCCISTLAIAQNDAAAAYGLIAMKSKCPQGDSNLFDAPINKKVAPLDRSKYGMESWKIVDALSDEFNYPTGEPNKTFKKKWKMGFVNNFTGGKPTVWTGKQVSIEKYEEGNNILVLEAKEVGKKANKRLHCGMISSWAKSSYPLYQEVKLKISNSQLAQAVWMLSSDPGTTEEIDNVEAYGPRIRVDGKQVEKAYFANRIHLSHHVFDKDESGHRLDYQPKKHTWMTRKKSENGCGRNNEVVWSDDYHYFGVKWVSPTRLEYFIDGALVKVVDGLDAEEGIDPEGYTKCGKGLTREMHMIISHAAQAWRYKGIDNFWKSADIKSGKHSRVKVDWLRVYSPSGTLNKRSCN